MTAADAVINEEEALAYIGGLTASAYYLYGVNVAGAGDGAKAGLVVPAGSATAIIAKPYGDPGGATGGLKAFFYKGATERDLALAYQQCKLRMRAFVNRGNASTHSWYVEHQIAGTRQGGAFVGMFLLWRVVNQ